MRMLPSHPISRAMRMAMRACTLCCAVAAQRAVRKQKQNYGLPYVRAQCVNAIHSISTPDVIKFSSNLIIVIQIQWQFNDGHMQKKYELEISGLRLNGLLHGTKTYGIHPILTKPAARKRFPLRYRLRRCDWKFNARLRNSLYATKRKKKQCRGMMPIGKYPICIHLGTEARRIEWGKPHLLSFFTLPTE